MKEAKRKNREKKPLPDHSDICGTGVVLSFKYKQTKELKTKFGFKASFPLRKRLDQCACDYLAYRNMPEAAVGEQKSLLKALEKHANALLDVLGKLGLQEECDIDIHLLAQNDPSIRGGERPLSRPELEYQVNNWRNASVKALSELTRRTAKGGRPLNILDRKLILDLHAIFKDGTGRDDRLTKISDTPDLSYGGKFFGFVDSFLTAIDCPRQNAQLGKLIEQSLKRIPKTSTK